MKKVQILSLTGSICLLLGVTLNLLTHFVTLPYALCFMVVPLLLASIALYTAAFIYYRNTK